MTIDWTKPLQTRDGRKVRILCRDSKLEPKCPVLGLIENPRNGLESLETWNENGSIYPQSFLDSFSYEKTSERDLINVPEERWIYVFKNSLQTFPSHTAVSAYLKKWASSPSSYLTIKLPEEK